jgi:hypothetical protein
MIPITTFGPSFNHRLLINEIENKAFNYSTFAIEFVNIFQFHEFVYQQN